MFFSLSFNLIYLSTTSSFQCHLSLYIARGRGYMLTPCPLCAWLSAHVFGLLSIRIAFISSLSLLYIDGTV